MKTEKDSKNSENSNGSVFDKKYNQAFVTCNETLSKTFNVIKSIPMGHKGQYYERILNKNNAVRHEQMRSQSVPNDLDDENKQNGNKEEQVPDTNTKLLAPQQQDSPPSTPSHESWFNTWPDRYEKLKAVETTPSEEHNNTQFVANILNGKGKVSLNDALMNMSLTYSPVTKQLHLIEPQIINKINKSIECGNADRKCADEDEYDSLKKLGHRRNEPGSFSSTISSLSDPSPSGSLLDSDDRSSPINDEFNGAKRKSLSSIFNKNVFSWKPVLPTPTSANSVWKLFAKTTTDKTAAGNSPKHENVVISSTALIPNTRPSNLPAKTEEEELRHREEFEAMVAAAKKKEALNTAAKQKMQKIQLQMEEQQAQSTKHFVKVVLPNWDAMKNTRKTKDLWWLGLPSSIRGRVWRLAIGNDLNLTPQLYEICSLRAQTRLNNPEVSKCDSDVDQESSMDLIQLDISRTFPNLCIFQQGGPFSEVLHSLLAAYVCYRPDVGYLQGMSYIAAILILNMDQFDAFVCFANLLNRPLHIAAFTLNQTQMRAYFSAYNEIFRSNLPKLHAHFDCAGLMPDLYLFEWIYTVFAKAVPLDTACRIWDVFLRDGDEFLFRAALGILHFNQEVLMQMDFLHGAQFLTRLPDDLPVDQLFKSIQCVNTSIGKQSFNQIVDRFIHH